MVRWILPLALAALAVVFHSTLGHAAQFECTTKQALKWEHGTLSPDPFTLKEKLEFDGATNTLWVEENHSGKPHPINMQILQELGPDSDLVAQYIAKGDNFYTTLNFRMRSWDKEAGLVFSMADGEGVSVGRCKSKQ